MHASLVLLAQLARHLQEHSHLILLLLQYSLLLPVVIVILRAGTASTGRLAPEVTAEVACACYLAIALPFGWYLGQSIYSADESTYLFQAKTLLNGRLFADAPPLQVAYSNQYAHYGMFFNHVMDDRHWFGKYPPGWPVVLAIAVWAKLQWLAAPLLGLILLLLAIRIARNAFGKREAGLTAFFCALSPYYVLNCVGYMSHCLAGVLMAAASLYFLSAVRARNVAAFAPVFLFVGLTLLVRPFTAVCVGAVFAASGVYALRRDRRMLLQVGVVAAAILLPFTAASLAYNKALTGSYWLSTYAYYTGTDFPAEISFQWKSVLHNITTFTRFGVQETALASFPFLFLLAGYAVWRECDHRFTAIVLAASFLILVFAYMLQTDESFSRIGERYYFDCFFAAVILGARGAVMLLDRYRLRRQNVIRVAFLFVIIQAFYFGLFGRTAVAQVRPYTAVETALRTIHASDAVVFLQSSRSFRAENLNLNGVEWKSAPAFYVPDPGDAVRPDIVRRLHRSSWLAIRYDDARQTAIAGPGGTLDGVQPEASSILNHSKSPEIKRRQ